MPDLVLLLVVILVLVLLWRGPKTLPKLGEAFGRGVKSVRDEIQTEDEPKDEGPGPAA